MDQPSFVRLVAMISLGSLGSLGLLIALATLSTCCQTGAIHGSRRIRDLREKSWARPSRRKSQRLVGISRIGSLIPHHIRSAHMDGRECPTALVQGVDRALFT